MMRLPETLAVEQPAGDDAVGLAVWFGAEFNAARVVACGDVTDRRLDVALDPSSL